MKTPKKFFEKIKFNSDHEFSIDGYAATAMVTSDPQGNKSIYIRVGFITEYTALAVLRDFAKKGLRFNENT